MHYKPLAVLIYSHKNADFDRYGNMFNMFNICIHDICIYKIHFPITWVKGKWTWAFCTKALNDI